MPKPTNQIPFLCALKSLRQQQIKGLIPFYSVIILIFVFVTLKVLTPGIQEKSLSNFHLRQPFVEWSLYHAVPWMYNYGNEIWVSPQPVDPEILDGKSDLPAYVHHRWMNHYPLRFITFNLFRSVFWGQSAPQHVYIRSGYRHSRLDSHYILVLTPEGMVMELAEEPGP